MEVRKIKQKYSIGKFGKIVLLFSLVLAIFLLSGCSKGEVNTIIATTKYINGTVGSSPPPSVVGDGTFVNAPMCEGDDCGTFLEASGYE